MANLIIKPTSGGSLILQDEGGDAALTVGTTGNVSLAGTVTAGTIENAPAGVTTKHFGFSAYLSGAKTVNNATWTEVDATWTERWDTDSKFASGRFTPTIQGIYLCGWSAELDEIDDGEVLAGVIRKNGTATDGTDMYGYQGNYASGTDRTTGINNTSLIQLDTNDYVSLWAYHNLASGCAFDYDSDGTVIKWHSQDITQPTDSAIEAKVKRLQDEYDAQAYARNRQADYPDIGDQLDDLYHAGAFSASMVAKLKKVNDDNPKG